ncbi:hypothetical protein BMR1_02g00245 [Babesia microti strain RI]|uniref:Uncharacterized protein n=1 Tax=Babesia microti (strain RI) TaxID=1133968 RepID=I7IPT9_BABMR|nr:hypothetical protein BMR1_02g00245 [Babesia microti strain RI]CCF73215.1 hypothetical protein BMR1_02g00245 [Babesia microti strain RI]|eukprot:XP_012647824.1 hypothetical protein BMR1_02g00245 [Babesia microti strain RI]
MSLNCFKSASPIKHIAHLLIANKFPLVIPQNTIITFPLGYQNIVYELTSKDETRRRQYAQIIGKIGIRKWDAGILWTHYKNKRIKIKKRRKVI